MSTTAAAALAAPKSRNVTHTLFGVYIGVLASGGLWLREPRLRALLPVTSGK